MGLTQQNVCALFVLPEFEVNGISRKFHDIMIDWYFKQTNEKIWLGTEQNTEAETFYKNRGWTAVGMYGDDEIKFKMTLEDWKNNIN